MWKKAKFVVLALVLFFAFAQAAQAGLQVGPLDPLSIYQGNPDTGFPSYYMDDQGTMVDLVPITGDGVNPPTQTYTPPDPANPYSVFLGFESEAFYFMARSNFSTKYGKAIATFGLEASFVNGVAVPGEEMVFVRIRLKAPVRDPGTYTFYHPWGSETIVVTQADINTKKAIFYTRDVGLVARDFIQATNGPITRFLHQTVPAPPPGWIGDGASVGPVTGSPIGFNAVKLVGPPGIDLDGKKNNFVQSNQFTVSGRLPDKIPASLSVERATVSDSGGQEYLDVFATSNPTASVVVSGAVVAGGASTLAGNTTGKFYGHISSNGQHGSSPFPITVTATVADPGFSPTAVTVNVVDTVNINQATYSITSQTLSVGAISSDALAQLTLNGFNLQGANDGILLTQATGVTLPPPTVTVTSSMGGSDTAAVVIVP